MTAQESTPRIGVYICHCGGNISDVVDVQRLADQAAALPNVVVARLNVFMCSDPGQTVIAQDIVNEHLDRVVVAACSPKLHETTFRGVLGRAGLNPYLYEHVNIREQVSWATGDAEIATAKAASLVAAAVAKASRLAALEPIRVQTTARAAVVGGGVAGLRAARDLARAGIEVALLERKATLGGNVAVLDRLFPNEEPAADIVTRLAEEVLADSRVTIYTRAAVERAEGYVGNFTLSVKQESDGGVVDAAARRDGPASGSFRPFEGYRLDCSASSTPIAAAPSADGADIAAGRLLTLEVGAIVVATGFEHYVPGKGEYGYGRIPQVITLPDFIKWLSGISRRRGAAGVGRPPDRSVAFMHCVGSRQAEGVNKPRADGKINEYCSRVCCTATLQAICDLHEKWPDVATFDFFQDIRAYGRGHEEYYEKASKAGTVFARWSAQPPSVTKAPSGRGEPRDRAVQGRTHLGRGGRGCRRYGRACGRHAAGRRSSLVGSLKLPVGTDRFLLEVHPKLRPVELAVGGVLVAGTSQGPKDVTETTASASAAAAKAMALLSSGHVDLDPFVAHVDAGRCEGNGLCVQDCPYSGAVAMHEYPDGRSRAIVNPALCSGCGACVAVCPTRAIDVAGWTLDQYDAMVDALLAGSEAPVR